MTSRISVEDGAYLTGTIDIRKEATPAPRILEQELAQESEQELAQESEQEFAQESEQELVESSHVN